MTEILTHTAKDHARAAQILRQGGLVALPTETVYGLAADARNDHAVAHVFAAKGRPQFNPLIVHVPDLETALEIAEFSTPARNLARQFWPGPLSLVVPLRADAGLSDLVSAGHDTVAIRVPHHPAMRAVLAEFGGPLAAPSANPSGRISPTSAAHVMAGLAGKIAAILDGGACDVGVESTIIMPGPPAVILREGGLAREDITPIIGPLRADLTPAQIRAPGQMARHYAPDVPVILGDMAVPQGALHVGFGPSDAALNLSPSADLTEAAANLFKTLHQAETMAKTTNAPAIHIATIPETGLGRAINDRLRRAAIKG